MDWNKTRPEVVGFYWWRSAECPAEVVYIEPNLLEQRSTKTKDYTWLDDIHDGEWYGPLEEPM